MPQGGQASQCFYYLLHWVFDAEGEARLATPEELNIRSPSVKAPTTKT
jgi:hypothetical protein